MTEVTYSSAILSAMSGGAVPPSEQESNVNTCAFKGITLVTAAGRGIGRAIALRPADDFDVAVNDIPSNVQALDSAVAEITAKGRRSILVLADVSVEGQVKNMVDTVVAKLGELDVVRAVASRHSASMLTLDDLSDGCQRRNL